MSVQLPSLRRNPGAMAARAFDSTTATAPVQRALLVRAPAPEWKACMEVAICSRSAGDTVTAASARGTTARFETTKAVITRRTIVGRENRESMLHVKRRE